MPKKKKTLTARTADKHVLYQESVQCPEGEIDFVSSRFAKLSGRPMRRIREDFCGTAFSACEFVKRSSHNTAVGLDLHEPTLAWGRKNNVAALPEDAQKRIKLLRRDVRKPGKEGSGVDAVLAMNFSYWIFQTREGIGAYYRSVYESLAKDGMFFLDAHGGYEATKEQEERRRCKGFTYIWDQHRFDPISGEMTCYIHFEFKRGPRMERAFTYVWRVWTLPETRELLMEAGFKKVTVYWEDDDGKGGGAGVFRPRREGEADASFICYIVAEK